MSTSTPQAFVCPECGKRLSTDPTTSEAILRSGCPYCTTGVTRADFVDE